MHGGEIDASFELPLLGRWQRFDSAATLGEALSAIPLAEVTDSDALPVERLREIAQAIGSHVGALVAEPHRISSVLLLLGDEYFISEQGWRDLLLAVDDAACDDEAKVMVLARYRRYLLRKIEGLEERVALEGDHTSIDPGVLLVEQTHAEPAIAATAGGGEPEVRLTKGVVTQVCVPVGDRTQISLGARRFFIEVGVTTSLLDEAGGRSVLRQGRNLVGRARYADVVIASEYHDVSRSHLIIEVFDGRPVSLTDLSSRGTRVPKHIIPTTAAA